MSEETDRRIEAAREEAERQKQTQEFLQSLKPGDTTVKPIYNPEAYILREKARGAAKRGEIPKTSCRHPLAYVQQYIDDDPLIKRKGNPVNLFECGVCHMLLWYVDPWGAAVTDD